MKNCILKSRISLVYIKTNKGYRYKHNCANAMPTKWAGMVLAQRAREERAPLT